MSTFTLTYTRYGALGLPEKMHEVTGEHVDVGREFAELLDTMTPGDTASLSLRHDLPASHPLRTE